MKIWVLSRKFATHSDSRPRVNSWNKHGSLKIDLSSIQTILWYTHCEWRWKCVILRFFNLPSVKMLIFSLEFDQSYPFTQMTQKVCQKSKLCKLKKTEKFWVNSEILSRVESLIKSRLELKLIFAKLFLFRYDWGRPSSLAQKEREVFLLLIAPKASAKGVCI